METLDLINEDSPYDQYVRDRHKINVFLWNSEAYADKQYHRICYDSGLSRLVPDPNKDGNMLCRNCGMTFSINDLNKQQELTKTVKAIPSLKQNTRPLIISQGSKTKRKAKFDTVNNDLDNETKSELRQLGYRI